MTVDSGRHEAVSGAMPPGTASERGSSRKRRYRFRGRSGGTYYWDGVLPVSPGDSRHEQVSCPVAWFWGRQPAADVDATVQWPWP
jgi:hypothetical protein